VTDQLGLMPAKIMVPVDHVLAPGSDLPALVVVRSPMGIRISWWRGAAAALCGSWIRPGALADLPTVSRRAYYVQPLPGVPGPARMNA
jgi:hypothetical protein